MSREDIPLDDLFGDDLIKEYPELKRFKLSSNDLISTSIEQGLLDSIWEDGDEMDGGNRRYGRTKKNQLFPRITMGPMAL